MVVSMLVTLRDQGVPLPAGAILISPWVDLTHSFPSLSGDAKLDYIPPHGFVHKPSASWPPPNSDDRLALQQQGPRSSQQKEETLPRESKEKKQFAKEEKLDRVRGFSVTSSGDAPDREAILKPFNTDGDTYVSANGKYSIGPQASLSVQLDESSRIEIKDQIQLYAANHLLTHPLVSPALQPTLGGLPPLLIQVGGGELLRDEQIYLAHKAAQPFAYLPPPSNHLTAEQIAERSVKYKPTPVQLQVWDDLCHVAPTLSFTRPAKHMYRSIAQFGAWALARAQKTGIDIMDDDNISLVSTDSDDSSSAESALSPDDIKLSMPASASHVGFESIEKKEPKGAKVGKAGDPLPPFEHHMIRQRIDRHGRIYVMEPVGEMQALNLATEDIGVPKPGPVHKWMKAQKEWNSKFAKEKLKVQKRRVKDMEKGYEGFEGESPPPTALAGRRLKGMKAEEKKKKRSWGMSLWSLWGSKHDSMTVSSHHHHNLTITTTNPHQLDREEKADASPDHQSAQSTTNHPDGTTTTTDGATDSKPKDHLAKPSRKSSRNRSTLAPATTNGRSRSGSRTRSTTVTDAGQIGASTDDLTRLNSLAPPIPGFAEATRIAPERSASALNIASDPSTKPPGIVVEDTARPPSPATEIPGTDTLSVRPTRGGVAYPFRLRVEGGERDVNASTLTLQSVCVEELSDRGAEDGDVGVLEGGVEQEQEQEEKEERGAEVVEENERPGVERFFTARPGELVAAKDSAAVTEEKAERPGVERFETAVEDLNTLAKGTKA
jgi:acetyl esterase/lipase